MSNSRPLEILIVCLALMGCDPADSCREEVWKVSEVSLHMQCNYSAARLEHVGDLLICRCPTMPTSWSVKPKDSSPQAAQDAGLDVVVTDQ